MTKKDAELLRAEKQTAIGSGLLSPNKGRKTGLEWYLAFDREESLVDSKPGPNRPAEINRPISNRRESWGTVIP